MKVDRDRGAETFRRFAAHLFTGGASRDERLSVSAGEIRYAVAHGLGAVALEHAVNGRIQLSPEDLTWLRGEVRRREVWSAVLDLEMERIAAAVAQAGASPPILLKGRSVARRYPNSSLRQYTDIDVLVPRGELAAWRGILRGLGFSVANDWEERVTSKFSHHVQYRRPVGNATILCEVHTSLFVERRARSVTYERLAEHAQPSSFGPALELDDHALLVALSLHHLHHNRGERRLITLYDVMHLASDGVVERARALSDEYEVQWAVDRTLWDLGQLVPRDRAVARRPKPSGALPRVKELRHPGVLNALALACEFGFWRGSAYLVSRFDPRRFVVGGRFSARTFGRWVCHMARNVLARR